jgi:hypothetical protein
MDHPFLGIAPQDTRSRHLVRADTASACAATRNYCAAAVIVRSSMSWTFDCEPQAKMLLIAQMFKLRGARELHFWDQARLQDVESAVQCLWT